MSLVELPNAKGIVLLMSGGMDSATLLHLLLTEGNVVYPMAVAYGQKHETKELRAASAFVSAMRMQFDHCEPLGIFKAPEVFDGSALLAGSDDPIPEGHYADETMRSTVVPNRNMMLLSMALAKAIELNADGVAYAAHAGDHAIYPDCRPAFIDAVKAAAATCHYDNLELWTPFAEIDKGDIAGIGRTLSSPYEHTWTCYNGGDKPCCKCGSCVERAEAFAKAKIPDPLLQEGPVV